jgi:hypothetical protein
MVNYIFHVREWNIEYFKSLEIMVSKNSEVNVLWFAMTISVSDLLKKDKKNVFYLPELFENCDSLDTNELQLFDDYLFQKYGFGVNYLTAIERFVPRFQSKRFIEGHFQTIFNLTPENSISIALSCDHLVYVLSSFITKYRNGEHYFIQPIGFPRNAQVIMETPWQNKLYLESGLSFDYLYDFIDSLKLTPESSIHYMKPQKKLSLLVSLRTRIKSLRARPFISIFSYLDKKPKNILPSRFKLFHNRNINNGYVMWSMKELENYDITFFYFPLQLEPEMSILAYSPYFKDQLEVIRLVSQSLKIGDLLLLKENPKMLGLRKLSFYDEVSKFPNVVWISPDVNSREIISKSFKVISITGTATIEAACMGINSILFGFPPFKKLIIEKPVADHSLSSIAEILYRNYESDVIISHLKENWSEFSKSILFDNYTPEYVDDTFTLRNPEILAENLFKLLINNFNIKN